MKKISGKILIRPGTTEDAPAVARVHIGTWQVAYRGQLPDEWLDSLTATIPQREAVWERIASHPPERSVFLVADSDGVVVGFVHGGPTLDDDQDSQRVGEIYAIYLDSGHWGLGAGKAMHDGALEALLGEGFQQASLWVLETNDRTRRWYERQGWRPDGATKKDARGEVVLAEVRYRKSLG